MSTLTFGVQRDGSEAINAVRNISSDDLDRVSKAAAYNWFRGGVPVEGGDPRAPTADEIVARTAQWVAEQIQNMVADAETRMAADAKASAPIEIK